MTPAAARAEYRRALRIAGEEIMLRRYSGSGDSRTATDYGPVLARVVAFDPVEIVGPVQQGDRRLIVLAEDVESSGFPTPFRRQDKAVVRDKELNVEAPDDNSRRIAGTLVAYEMRVRG